jgi:hypothetical protein
MVIFSLVGAVASCTSVQTPRSFPSSMAPCVASSKNHCQVIPPVSEEAKQTVAGQIQETERLQAEYVGYIQDLAGLSPTLNVGLIGLSALSLYKGITNPNSSDLAAAGAIGSAAFAYGNQANTKQRQQIYLSGFTALICATSAAQPYNFPGIDFKKLNSDAQNALAALRKTRAEVAYLSRTVTVTQPEHTLVSNCTANQKPYNCEGKSDKVACEKVNQNLAKVCQSKTVPEKKTVTGPSAEFTSALEQADTLIAAAEKNIDAMSALKGRIDQMAGQLKSTREDIAAAVEKERVKLEPDLNNVPATLQGLRDTAKKISGAGAFDAQSGTRSATTAGRQEANKPEADAIARLATAGIKVLESNAQLKDILGQFNARLQQATPALSKCLPLVPVVLSDTDTAPTASPAAPVAPPDNPGATASDDIWTGLGFNKNTGEGDKFKTRLSQCRLLLGLSAAPILDAATKAGIQAGTCKKLGSV